tara:strand:+ start:383 stop:1195 length:813 start_codon:yes stop_codon:yes gene_type:complete
MAVFTELGFEGELWPGATNRAGYFAGTHEARAQRLKNALTDSTSPLWMIRGGFGAIHTLEHGMPLFEELAPRALWGFSDGTALLSAWIRQGWPAWHAPPITQLPRLDEESRTRLQKACFEGHVAPLEDLDVLNGGSASGPLAGGNLTVLASLVGTPFAAEFSESILLLEDVSETAYRVDRLVTQLRLSGALDGVRGLVLGQFTDIPEAEMQKIRAFFEETSRSLNIPCVWGAPIGHGNANATVPMGAGDGWQASLTAVGASAHLEFQRDG